MRLKRYLFPTAVTAAFVLAFVLIPDAMAQFGLDEAAGKAGLKSDRTVPGIIGNLIKAALSFVGTIFLLLMLYAGFLYLTAQGDSKKVDQAKQLIKGAIIGVVIIASAYAITDLVLRSATGAGGANGSPTTTVKPDGSVAIGGDCTQSSECTPASTTVCDGGKCVSTIQ